jgi:hypothetical protein
MSFDAWYATQNPDHLDELSARAGWDACARHLNPSSNYTADSIKVLEPEEAANRFTWLRAAVWSREYAMPLEWCERALEACRRSDVDPEYIERKYLKRESVERIEFVDAAMMAILVEQRDEAKRVAERQRGRSEA